MQMMAVRPPFMMLPFTAFSGSARKTNSSSCSRGHHHDHDRAAHLHLACLCHTFRDLFVDRPDAGKQPDQHHRQNRGKEDHA